MSASEAVNLHIWERSIAPVVYLNGVLLFVAGHAIVRAHNRWVRGWPLLVTLVGWLGVVAGLVRMFAPELPQGGRDAPTYALIAALFVVGAVLSVYALARRD